MLGINASSSSMVGIRDGTGDKLGSSDGAPVSNGSPVSTSLSSPPKADTTRMIKIKSGILLDRA